uniref:ACB domain-containing protein n=1 Tax=Elaeophora elaphi TaxID=1147741 RepID=A0A0R3S4Z4_9BILA
MLSDSVETIGECTYDAAFKAAVDIIQNLPKKGVISISANQKLRLYSLFKQGISGKCNVPCPPLWRAVDRMKWRAWDALGSMDSLEAKKTYVAELKNIISHVQHKYDIAELSKGSDERTVELLREKLSILGYGISDLKRREDLDDFRRQLCHMAEESCEMKILTVRRFESFSCLQRGVERRKGFRTEMDYLQSSGINELSDQCSESSTSTGEYIDALCCNHVSYFNFLSYFKEPCICNREQPSNQRLLSRLQDRSRLYYNYTRSYNNREPSHAQASATPAKRTLRDIVIMASSSASRADVKVSLPNRSECFRGDHSKFMITCKRYRKELIVDHCISSMFSGTNVELLFKKIDDLEQMKAAVSETLLDVVDKRIAYPKMITSYVTEAGKFRMKRMEEAKLIWQTESIEKKDVEKMLEMINEVKEAEKESDVLLQRLEEV